MTSVSNSLDPDHAQHFVRPDIGANYLLKLSVDDTCRYRVKWLWTRHRCFFILFSYPSVKQVYHRSRHVQRKIVNIFLPININICFGCSKEASHWTGSFENPQHMFQLRNKKNIFQIHTFIIYYVMKYRKYWLNIMHIFHSHEKYKNFIKFWYFHRTETVRLELLFFYFLNMV